MDIVPSELILEMITLLPRDGQLSTSLASRSFRQLTLPFIFGEIWLGGKMGPGGKRSVSQEDIDWLMGASQEIKSSVKSLTANSVSYRDDRRPDLTPIYNLIKELPNLAKFRSSICLDPQDLEQLLKALEHAPLHFLSLEKDFGSLANGPSVKGLTGLKTLSLKWRVSDGDERGSCLAHLSELIHPSLDTLINLWITDHDLDIRPNFEAKHSQKVPQFLDFRHLRPSYDNLTTLKYNTVAPDTTPLFAMAEMFPNLTEFDVIFSNHSSPSWTDDCLRPLSSLKKLTHLKLGIDLEAAANDELVLDHDLPWYLRCFTRRWEIAKDITAACIKIESITFEQLKIDSEGNNMEHSFIISKDEKGRPVKPVKAWWMNIMYWGYGRHVEGEFGDRDGIPDDKDMVDEEDYFKWRNWPSSVI